MIYLSLEGFIGIYVGMLLVLFLIIAMHNFIAGGTEIESGLDFGSQ